jgi:hypothetical protein
MHSVGKLRMKGVSVQENFPEAAVSVALFFKEVGSMPTWESFVPFAVEAIPFHIKPIHITETPINFSQIVCTAF